MLFFTREVTLREVPSCTSPPPKWGYTIEQQNDRNQYFFDFNIEEVD